MTSTVPEARVTSTDVLRVIDFGRVTPLRSQTLWHAIAYGVSAGQPPTLSFARPSGPYVCLGYLRDAAEVDRGYCRAHGLPVYRRMVGGGPVYLDERQLFFQIVVPASDVPPSRAAALRAMLEPAVAAFRAAGVEAVLDGNGEICLGDRKICGHGAGQIEGAVVVCGNMMEAFDHERATDVLALPDPLQRSETLRLMRRYVTATPADPEVFKLALASAYSAARAQRAVPGQASAAEQNKTAELDRRFRTPQWLDGPHKTRSHLIGPQGTGPEGTAPRGAWQRLVKIRAGIWTLSAQAADGARLVASVVNGTLDRAVLRAPGCHDHAHEADRSLTGTTVASAAEKLGQRGASGRELAAALAAAEGRL